MRASNGEPLGIISVAKEGTCRPQDDATRRQQSEDLRVSDRCLSHSRPYPAAVFASSYVSACATAVQRHRRPLATRRVATVPRAAV